MDEERDIRRFFDDMKSEEGQKAVPDFDLLTPSTGKPFPWKRLAAVAAVLIAVSVWIFLPEKKTSHPSGEIVIEIQQEFPSESLMSADVDLMNWDASTDYLLEN